MDIFGNLFNANKRGKIIGDLYKLGIPPGKYTINDDLTVDIHGDFTLKSEEGKIWTHCPIIFRIVYGNFIWHYGNLTTLINMPIRVTKNFSVAYNNLTSLQYSPNNVGLAYICNGNELKNLKGCTQNLQTILAVNCNLTSLEGAPKSLVNLMVANNKLKDLSFLPTKIENSLEISNNLLESFEGLLPTINILKNISFENNPCTKELQEYLDKNNFNISNSNTKYNNNEEKPEVKKSQNTDSEVKYNMKDYIILNNESSKYHNFKGRITQVNPNNTYTVLFDKERNPSLEKDGMIADVKPNFLIKDNPIFHIGDYVLFSNSNSKFDGTIGEVTEKMPKDGYDEYKIKALMSENPNLSQSANAASVTRGWSVITGIVTNELTKTTKPKEIINEQPIEKAVYNGIELAQGNNFKPNDKAYYINDIVKLIKPTSPNTWQVQYMDSVRYAYPMYTVLTPIYKGDPKDMVLHPNNRFSIGDKANYYSSMVELVEPISPTKWKFKYPSGFTTITEYTFLTPITPLKFNEGEKVVIDDVNSRYYNKKGTVLKIHTDENDKLSLVDIELDAVEDKSAVILKSYPKNKVRIYLQPTVESNADRVFIKGEKIIYIAHKNNTLHNDCHLRKGEISLVNTAANLKDTYDLVFDRIKGETYDKRIVNIPWTNLLPLEQDFSLGDKVVIFEPSNEHHDIVGVVSEVSDDETYKISYNDNDNKSHTIKGVKPNQLVKYHKPFGTQCNVDDNIKYTKPNSRYNGYTGVVTKFDKTKKSKPYAVEITTKDGTKVNLWSDDCDLETIPGPRNFKSGDKIRYNNPGHGYDGYIGQIQSIGGTKKNRNYELILKYSKGNIYMNAKADQIMLLEEAPESATLKIGDKVKYMNSKSKWDNKTGEFIGFRNKDGKNQLGVKFQDTTNLTKTIYFDEGEGKLEVIQVAETKPSTPTYTYSSGANTTITKKKKKDGDDEPRKPVLVYNRRHSVRRAKSKPSKDSQEEGK